MRPMAYLPSYQTASKSTFPEVWIIKRATIVARLFYHTAMALLGAMHPLASMDQSLANEMAEMKLNHARQICGIVAHVKDR
jgi:UTP:GlnB (protein PII) uridylyltransferase